jgi:5-(carboxyamino)imidazole ribonucleotide synthase
MNIGILGAGQLGRMLAISGYPLNHKFAFAGNNNQESAAFLGKMFIAENNIKSLAEFADVITYESENINIKNLQQIEKNTQIYPREKSLYISQHRVREKVLFKKLNIPFAPYKLINSLKELKSAIDNTNLPAILKTTTLGYDGKGQFFITSKNQAEQAWNKLKNQELILEDFIDFKKEFSIVAVRDINDNCKFYQLVENTHHQGILRITIANIEDIDLKLQKTAEKYVSAILNEMDHIGVLTLEMFATKDGLIANEIAPRVHNSGHWTINAANTSQFENHIRAISKMPIGDTKATHKFVAMINIIGKIGLIDKVLKLENSHLHLYDKEESENRKLGHINITANTKIELENSIYKLNSFLPNNIKINI